jgi:hypothetical protein
MDERDAHELGPCETEIVRRGIGLSCQCHGFGAIGAVVFKDAVFTLMGAEGICHAKHGFCAAEVERGGSVSRYSVSVPLGGSPAG